MNRPTRRLSQLFIGLLLYGWSMAMLVRSDLGLDPWDVFHQGLSLHLPFSFGQVVIGVGAAVLLLWIPLRQKPGIGTVANIIVIGLAADLGLGLIPTTPDLLQRTGLLLAGVVLNGLAGALYVGARLGTGPRDGLWMAISRRSGRSIRLVRTILEVTVLGLGWLLGGVVGVGTIVYALAIGPLVQWILPLVDVGTATLSSEDAGATPTPASPA